MKPLLFLIGYRGTGKTTVGNLLAQRSGWQFIDADVHLEATHGRTIKQIFADEGEAGFRDKETKNLQELTSGANRVIATGGGIILKDENRRLLREHGFTVWLTAGVDTIAQRIADDPTTVERRPNLTTGGLAEIQELLRIREPIYRQSADLVVDTEGQSPDSIAETILNAWIPSRGSGSASSSASGRASAAS